MSVDSITVLATNENQEVDRIRQKIETSISQVTDDNQKKICIKRLADLIEGPYRKDVYFYSELLEDLISFQNLATKKRNILGFIRQLNQTKVSSKFKTERNAIIQDCIMLTNKEKINENEYGEISSRCQSFFTKNNNQVVEDSIIEKERMFLKGQLVRSLKDLDYDVAEDTTVIDFENKSDFLFKVPRQDNNYINLRFKLDGSFLYNPLTSEKIHDLGCEEKMRKLAEMELTCREFKHILNQLSNCGIDIKLRHVNPVNEKAFTQVPEMYQGDMAVFKKKKKIRSTKPQQCTLKKKALH